MQRVTVILGTLAILTAQIGYSQATYSVIYSFGKLPDGARPHASVVIGAQGALFGTTYEGGMYGYGTVFELSNPTGTTWTETVLHNFDDSDGRFPRANLVFGSGGVLYGTTEGGGSGAGTIFQLAPPASPGGDWTQSVLYSFDSNPKSQLHNPYGGVLIGTDGTLYTTTAGGGIIPYGTVFALVPPATQGGAWAGFVVYAFGQNLGSAGSLPLAGLVSEGRSLYGTNFDQGDGLCDEFGCGAVYELTPPAALGGAWTETTLHAFTGPPNDGGEPEAALTVGAGGVLYGTTLPGGPGLPCLYGNLPGCGTIFQLTPPSTPGGTWTESVIYGFTAVKGDGAFPVSSVTVSKNGKIYGTTQYGGSATSGSPCSYSGITGCGTLFELTPPAAPGGPWTETILHSFTGQSGDGSLPVAGLVISSTGVLYGTTSEGGAYNKGTVFAIEP
jgi:uncharacterized repeat protein (TIGR03803 family)